jgi:hypothetical protein
MKEKLSPVVIVIVIAVVVLAIGAFYIRGMQTSGSSAGDADIKAKMGQLVKPQPMARKNALSFGPQPPQQPK